MSKTPSSHPTVRLVAVALGALLVGIVVTLLLPLDPFGVRGSGETADGLSMEGDAQGGDAHAGHGHEGDASLWTCGMHPQVLQDEPGQCPICGMDLTPVAGDTSGAGSTLDDSEMSGSGMAGPGPVISIDAAVVQNMNVLTEPALRRDLKQPIRTVGYLEYDHESMVTVTTKYSGWVEKVYVSHIGDEVRRGQPLFDIYSPELVQTEQELLSALSFVRKLEDAPEDARERAQSMVESARQRLRYWDVTPQQIRHLEETGKVFRTLTVFAPSSGIVMERRMGLEGMAVTAGMQVFQVADLSSLLLSVELFEGQLAWVQHGAPAEITFTYFPGETFQGRVHLLEPGLSDMTRTLKAKIGVSNPDGRLRKGMYATVRFDPVVVEQAISVPGDAVLRTGQRNVVVVALGDGHFEPRAVTLGHEAEGYVQILEGLEEGAEVVTSAQFLLDSESKLREAIQKIIAQRDRG